MDKKTFDALSQKERTTYIIECSPAELEELFKNGAIKQSYYDLFREYRGILPEERAKEIEAESLKVRRQMAAFA